MQASFFLSFKQSLKLFLRIDPFVFNLTITFLNILTSSLEGLALLVSLFNLLVVFEVTKELAPRDELLMVDCIILLVELHHFVHLVALDLIEDLI